MIFRRCSRPLAGVLFALCPVVAPAQSDAGGDGWRDASPHREGFVDTGGARVHYLDWGGNGLPIVLVPALGSTAHTFDHFAPLLADHFRVVAVTRRGFGQSSRPAAGYDTESLATDVLAVLDRLGLRRVIVVAHSMGGAEAAWLATRRSKRVAALVLLESYCYGCRDSAIPAALPPRPPGTPLAYPRASSVDRRSFAAFAAYVARVTGGRPPEAELRTTHRTDSLGTVGPRNEAPHARAAIRAGLTTSAYIPVRVPVLFVLATPETPEQEVPWVRPLRGQDRVWARYDQELRKVTALHWAKHFRSVNPHATVRLVAGGAHHVYLSHPKLVAKVIRDFSSAHPALRNPPDDQQTLLSVPRRDTLLSLATLLTAMGIALMILAIRRSQHK